MQFQSLKPNEIGLISQDETGNIYQIALTEEQSKVINMIVASMSSKEKPLVRLPKEYDLILKNKDHNECTHENTEFQKLQCSVCVDCGEVVEIDV